MTTMKSCASAHSATCRVDGGVGGGSVVSFGGVGVGVGRVV